MARGWESKSVEAQQSEAAQEAAPRKPLLSAEDRAKLKKQEGLLLQRRRVAEQLESASNASYRKMLEHALADLDGKLSALNLTR